MSTYLHTIDVCLYVAIFSEVQDVHVVHLWTSWQKGSFSNTIDNFQVFFLPFQSLCFSITMNSLKIKYKYKCLGQDDAQNQIIDVQVGTDWKVEYSISCALRTVMIIKKLGTRGFLQKIGKITCSSEILLLIEYFGRLNEMLSNFEKLISYNVSHSYNNS